LITIDNVFVARGPPTIRPPPAAGVNIRLTFVDRPGKIAGLRSPFADCPFDLMSLRAFEPQQAMQHLLQVEDARARPMLPRAMPIATAILKNGVVRTNSDLAELCACSAGRVSRPIALSLSRRRRRRKRNPTGRRSVNKPGDGAVQCEIIHGRFDGNTLAPFLVRRIERAGVPEQHAQRSCAAGIQLDRGPMCQGEISV
jgi:hypothetical protein